MDKRRSETIDYGVWKRMHHRCYLPTNKSYSTFGGKGIKICDEWHSFETFYNDMGARPSAKHIIMRLDDTKDFSKDNCKWGVDKLLFPIGHKSGDLTVIEGPETRSTFKRGRNIYTDYYKCLCVCGKVVERVTSKIKKGKDLHCGCKSKLQYKPGDIINGWKYVTDADSTNLKWRKIIANCPVCDKETNIGIFQLTRNKPTKSCGCKNKIFRVEKSKSGNVYHGHSKKGQDNTYKIWTAMKQRCFNPNNTRYSSYGGRGIYVCDRWKNSFLNFLEDMGPRPGPEYSIDRIDVNGNYEPSNCRWATPEIQQANKRPTKGIPRIQINIGDRFGKLKVIAEAESYYLKSMNNKEYRRVKTLCDCGNERICFITDLLRGKSMQCAPCGINKRKAEGKYKGSKKGRIFKRKRAN
jgi:hypothetical protein